MLREYLAFGELLGSDVNRKSADYFIFYQTYDALLEGSISDSMLSGSLAELTKAVSVFHGVKPILLIDEYDHLLIKSFEKGFRDKIVTAYKNFLGEALKSNEHLGRAILTGVQRVAKESIFSELNNFVVYTVLDKKYSSYFGLNTEETRQILAGYNMELNADVQRYYDGYLFGGVETYNPWSILSYVEKEELRPYWINTSTNVLIRESIKKADQFFHKSFEKLISDGEVDVSANLEASFLELKSTATLWGLLINSGYLTVSKQLTSGACRIRIPNSEVKGEFRQIVAIYTHLGSDTLDELFGALIDQDMDRFTVIYERLILELVSYHDTKDENSFHMLFLGMSISTSGMYKITSNIESDDGRHDIIMESLLPEIRPHIVIEFKHGENLEELKHEALKQIKEKRYYGKLHGKVLCIGIAHYQKKCQLVYEEISDFFS